MAPKVKSEDGFAMSASAEPEGLNNNGSGNMSLNASLGIPLTNASSTTSGSTDFVKKLFLMLEDNSYDQIVRWTSKGDSFVVLDTNEFTKVILPKHFKHSNFASFVRQLNKYDFHKVKLSNEEKQLNEYGEGAWEFKHPDFRRHDREALETIKRKGPAQKRSNEDTAQETIIKLEDTVSKLTHDQKILFDELKVMNSKYTNVIESIITLKNTNDRYFRSINTLVNCLASNGIKLPQLDLPPIDSPMIQQQAPQPQAQQPKVQMMIQQPQPQQAHQPSLHRSSNSQGSPQGLQQLPPQPNQQPLPAQPQPPQPQAQDSRPESQQLQSPLKPGFHVLLVEDDNVCIQLCQKFLVKYGCTVEVVTDGLTAISALETSRYDIVLMDIVMPNLDGATATSIVRNFDNETPIIAMTGNIDTNDLVTYLRHGMSDILAKPFTKNDLYSMLQKYLSKRVPLLYQQQGSVPPPPPQAQVDPNVSHGGSISNSVSPNENDHINKKQKV